MAAVFNRASFHFFMSACGSVHIFRMGISGRFIETTFSIRFDVVVLQVNLRRPLPFEVIFFFFGGAN